MVLQRYAVGTAAVILSLLISFSALAAPKHAGPGRGFGKKPGYMLDNRHHHNHYYPRRGHVFRALPGGYRVVPWHGKNFYFSSGVWYRSTGTTFIVTAPPIGLIVPFLPSVYTTVWVGNTPYYYAAGTYYLWEPEYRAYQVVAAPPEREAITETERSTRLFIYPKQEQSEQQQATDRYECHSWARSQSGFDPTEPGGGVAGDQVAARSDYLRAMRACLEARGYSVQ